MQWYYLPLHTGLVAAHALLTLCPLWLLWRYFCSKVFACSGVMFANLGWSPQIEPFVSGLSQSSVGASLRSSSDRSQPHLQHPHHTRDNARPHGRKKHKCFSLPLVRHKNATNITEISEIFPAPCQSSSLGADTACLAVTASRDTCHTCSAATCSVCN